MTTRIQAPVPTDGVWLRTDAHGRRLEVLVEVDRQWVVVISEMIGAGPISHIVEPSGIRRALAEKAAPDAR